VIRLRPMPPRRLSDEQRGFWNVVVGLFPATYFQGDDLDLLAEYCAVCSVSTPLWGAISEAQSRSHTPDGLAFLRRLIRIQNGQTSRMIRLHRQLRLGRYRTDAA
jgi:hypothetical protein